jgi:hypothetical protein
MIRPSTALWGAAVVLVGYAMFQVKYEVMQQEAELARINHQIAGSREQVRILNAEWSFLTQPTRLDALAHRYLDLVPIGTAELGTIASIPFRNPAQAPSQAQAPADASTDYRTSVIHPTSPRPSPPPGAEREGPAKREGEVGVRAAGAMSHAFASPGTSATLATLSPGANR